MVLVLAVLTVVAVVRAGALRRQVAVEDSSSPPASAALVCPTREAANASQDPHPADGRVYGGKLSYPRLKAPWGSPIRESRVPFGRDARSQLVYTEREYQPHLDWAAWVLVAQLSTGDGFATPQQAIDTVSRCILGTFYHGHQVDRSDRDNRASTVDGHDAWYLDMHVSYDIPGLQAKGEEVIIVIVRTALDEMSIYYASIPDNADPELLKTAYRTIDQLTVS